ncbi:MAG: hypothetical protein ACRENM_01850 [Candidatus Dormibacteraceae bacterium]
MTFDEVVKGLRSANHELQTEGRLVRAGLKSESESAAIVERWARFFSDEALQAAEGPGEPRKRVRHAIQQGMIDRRTAVQNDRLETRYSTATVTVEGDQIPFYSAQASLARLPQASRREAVGLAVAELEESLEADLASLTAATLEVIRGFGFDSYIAFWSDQKQVDYAALRAEVNALATSARDLYQSWMEPRLQAFGCEFGSCPQWHLSYLRALPQHDAAFTPSGFEPAMRRTADRLGLPLFSSESIHIDLADRPSKNPRASVWVPDAGIEVHLLTRPTGGSSDYAAFLHEAGHALHFGLSDPTIGWPLCNLGRSMAYPELWSYLFERIGHDPAWIADATGAGARQAEVICADLTGADLMLFSRYVGKLNYELDLYAGDPLDPARGRSLYQGRLSSWTGFDYDPRPWQFDRDPGFYSADYLRAWLAEASVEAGLRGLFGEHWWSNRDAGAWLREKWREGWIPEAEDVVASIGGTPWSGAELLQNFEARLARR